MFALEIDFADEVSRPEVLLVRRPVFTIGGDEDDHVVVEDLKVRGEEIRIARQLGRAFLWRRGPSGGGSRRHRRSGDEDGTLTDSNSEKIAAARQEEGHGPKPFEEQFVAEGEAVISLEPIKIRVVALDVDLSMRDGEPPDYGGVRILRSACSRRAPRYPALVISDEETIAFSFAPEQAIYIGRGRGCALRLDRPEISSMHARVGFDDGEFWIEDLGSTNGTFVNGQQVAGRVVFSPGSRVVLAREVELRAVLAPEDEKVSPAETRTEGGAIDLRADSERYPILLAVSPVCRPAKVVLPPSGLLRIGRDPANDLWLGAPHISRLHCEVRVEPGQISVVDRSANGTRIQGVLVRSREVVLPTGTPTVLDFGEGITVALCFSCEEEQRFIEADGAPTAFSLRETRFGARSPTDVMRRLTSRDGDGDHGNGDLRSEVFLAPEADQQPEPPFEEDPLLREDPSYAGLLLRNRRSLVVLAAAGALFVVGLILTLLKDLLL